MTECECLKVQPLGDGVWQCIMGDCRRKFIPADVCGKCPESQVEPQEPPVDPYERDYFIPSCSNE